MKNILILTILFISQAYAQSVDGAMDCTATGNVVVSSEEGKFKTYSGLQGGVNVNEVLNLTYSVTNNSIYISLKRDKAENNIVINSRLSTNDVNTSAEKGKGGGFVLETKFNHSVSFTPDYIRIYEFKEFVISRYYKNDWHGIYVYVSPLDLSTQTITLNCRHTNDKMDSAFKIFNVFKNRK